jgi:hypothetical protein
MFILKVVAAWSAYGRFVVDSTTIRLKSRMR